MSLTKRLYAARTTLWRFPSNNKNTDSADTRTLKTIWPDGTWNLPWGAATPASMDDCVRGILIDAWVIEERSAVESMRQGPLGGDWDPSPIPVQWQVSMAALKKSVKAENHRFVAYVGARLEGMGRLKS